MSGFLLDTNVVSDLAKGKRANAGVARWLAETFEDQLFISVITIAEIEKGLTLAEHRSIDTTRQRHFLEHALLAKFRGRILSFDLKCARRWGVLLANLGGDKIAERALAIDAQIAAVAVECNLTVCTRNVRDFQQIGIDQIVDPFT